LVENILEEKKNEFRGIILRIKEGKRWIKQSRNKSTLLSMRQGRSQKGPIKLEKAALGLAQGSKIKFGRRKRKAIFIP